MAKVGEGDSRWIVENREDGRNVNNWHWSETDCMGWTKTQLAANIGNLTIVDNQDLVLKTLPTVTVTGECKANNRKGKTIFLYEMEVKVGWEATFKDETNTKVKGDFVMPCISEEDGEDKPRVNVTTPDSNAQSDRAKDLARTQGIPLIQQGTIKYIRELKQHYQTKPTPPQTRQATDINNNNNNVQTLPPTSTTTTATTPEPSMKLTPKPKTSTNTKTLTLKEEFQASPMDAYDVFVNVAKLQAFTQAQVKFEAKDGGQFELYGGHISGTNQKLSPGSQIVQQWRLKSWPDNVFSTVTINFSVGSKPVTNVEIVQTGIPTEEYDNTLRGWKENILERIKMVFGFGSRIY